MIYLLSLLSIAIGIFFIVTGIKNSKLTFSIAGALVTVWAILMFLFAETNNGPALSKTLLSGFTLILIVVETTHFSYFLKCKERIYGKYVGYEFTPGGKHRYGTPIFEYEYNRVYYSEKSRFFYGRLKLKRLFKEGKEYEIYVNKKNPKEFILHRRPKFGDVMLLLFSLLLIILAVGALVSPETISFNIEL